MMDHEAILKVSGSGAVTIGASRVRVACCASISAGFYVASGAITDPNSGAKTILIQKNSTKISSPSQR
jgi:hypothetical protein